MFIQQIYTGCLAQGAYYLESQGEAAIIDPLREVQPYLDMARGRNAKIKYIFETHFHADFVSGHLTLAEKTGAPIVFGPNAETEFTSYSAQDGERFFLGDLLIRTIHTPGHTMESTCFLVIDKDGQEQALFSGDTLFLGDVGRPDLAQKQGSITEEELAGLLFDSLREKIMVLPDKTTIYPAHGAGSACGKKMSSDTIGTLGEQKSNNYALRADMTKEEFIAEVTAGLLPPPAYFPANVRMNKEGYQSIDQVLKAGLTPLSPEQFEQLANSTSALILDVRTTEAFAENHVPNSIFIGLDGGFAPWVGAMIRDTETPLLLVAEQGKEEEAITRLSRVGFDHVLGYLNGEISAWTTAGKPTESVEEISAMELKGLQETDEVQVIDVRKASEYDEGHVPKAKNVPLDQINLSLQLFSKNETIYVHCAGGYRSMIALSILKSRGYHNGVNVQGGYKAIQAAGLSTASAQNSNV